MQFDADDFIKVMEEERHNNPVKMNKGLAIECIETQRQFVDDLTREAFDMAIKALEEPERKRGTWIERNPNNSPECRLIECSECGFSYIVGMGLLLEDWAEGRNFCIRCGADMRGDSDDSDTD